MVTNYGQVARRSEILHYKRYFRTSENNKDTERNDIAEFRNAVVKLQAKWPCATIPNIAAISDELMEATLGSVGLLKSLLLLALEMQLSAYDEKWQPRFLARAAKSISLTKKILEETEDGERRISGSEFGDSMFSAPEIFARIVAKMEKPHAFG